MGTGFNIKKYRELKGWSLRKLAREMPISPSALSRAEKLDRDLDTKNLFRASDLLGVPVEVLRGTDNKEANHIPLLLPSEWESLDESERDFIRKAIDMVKERRNK